MDRVTWLLVALWMAMIPPASSSQRISVEPGGVDHLRQRLGSGKLRTESGR